MDHSMLVHWFHAYTSKKAQGEGVLVKPNDPSSGSRPTEWKVRTPESCPPSLQVHPTTTNKSIVDFQGFTSCLD